MKLSKKGYEKLFEFFMSGKYFDATKCDQIDFEPDDFQGCVVLTVEEAKMLEDMALRWMFLNPKNVTLKSAQLMKQLCQQIGQAERKE